MGKTLLLECPSGISGDMTVAALLDLGADQGKLEAALMSLPLEGFETRVSRVSKSGVDACDFDVVLGEGLENHDHDMEWLYGHLHGHDGEGHHGHGHGHEHGNDRGYGHEHGHGHRHHHHSHSHVHRTFADVLAVLEAADLTPRASSTARSVFEILARAEAKAHGTTPDKVHFHEVGAVDSIVDVVSAAVCLDDLDIDEVVVADLTEGLGTVRCAHGILPVPVPAVASIVTDHGIALRRCNVEGELVTPTGAAIVAAVRTRESLPGRYRIARVGIGAGKRSYEGACGFLRASIVEEAPQDEVRDVVVKLECDVDDCTGEALGHALELLMKAGAREVHYLPIFTKKNRPAWQVQVLCSEEKREALEAILFEQTTTIGVRRCAMERTVLPRRATVLETPYGPIGAKEVVLPDGSSRAYPEHDEVAAASERSGASYQDVLRAAMGASAL